jgi:hypothetical protein
MKPNTRVKVISLPTKHSWYADCIGKTGIILPNIPRSGPDWVVVRLDEVKSADAEFLKSNLEEII